VKRSVDYLAAAVVLTLIALIVGLLAWSAWPRPNPVRTYSDVGHPTYKLVRQLLGHLPVTMVNNRANLIGS